MPESRTPTDQRSAISVPDTAVSDTAATDTAEPDTTAPEPIEPAAAAAAEFEKPESWTRIMGLPLGWFALIFAVVIASVVTESMGSTMLSGFAVVITIGALLHWIGGRVPVLRNYGLPTVLCILVPATLVFFGLFPASLAETMDIFTDGDQIGFIDFYIASLIAGSILGMPRALLLKAGARYGVPLITTILVVFGVIAMVGHLIGFGLRESVLFIAAPVMGGGVGAGIVPMSQIYESQIGGSASAYVAQLIPAVIIANILAIVCAGVFNGITYKGQQFFLGFNGNGRIIRIEGKTADFSEKPRPNGGTFQVLVIGMMLAATIFLAGNIVANIIPGLHAYAWTILLAALVKVFGLVPEVFEDAVSTWFGFVSKTLTPALLVGISITYFEFEEMGAALSDWRYLALVVLGVATAVVCAGTIGWLVKMYFVETSVAVGLGMTDMGGTGDVAVVSAANRLELMPFLQVSSRIGGALVLLLVSLLIPVVS